MPLATQGQRKRSASSDKPTKQKSRKQRRPKRRTTCTPQHCRTTGAVTAFTAATLTAIAAQICEASGGGCTTKSIMWEGNTVDLHPTKPNVFCYAESHANQGQTLSAITENIHKAPKSNHIIVIEDSHPSKTPQPVSHSPSFDKIVPQLRHKMTPKDFEKITKFEQKHQNIYTAFADHESPLKNPAHIYASIRKEYEAFLFKVPRKQDKRRPINLNMLARARALEPKLAEWKTKNRDMMIRRDDINFNLITQRLVSQQSMDKKKPCVYHVMRGAMHLLEEATLTSKCSNPLHITAGAKEATQAHLEIRKDIEYILKVTESIKLTKKTIKQANSWAKKRVDEIERQVEREQEKQFTRRVNRKKRAENPTQKSSKHAGEL